MDKALQPIVEKVEQGIRLDAQDGLTMLESHDLITIGQLAYGQKLKQSGHKVFYNVNRHLNLTNVCQSLCSFCAFGVEADHPDAYVMDKEQALQVAREADAIGATELHVVSALHPTLTFDYYLDLIKTLHQNYPQMIIQGFTAVEIEYFARISGMSIEQVLRELQAAGLEGLPGGGAEILDDSLRSVLCSKKASSQQWLDVHYQAHKLGIRTNATMLYGHIESREQRINHLITLRELQDKTGGIMAFIPLPFLPDNTSLSHITRTSAVEDLQMIAISRLMLDNIDHIKAFWIMLGIQVAQIALKFGADDLDGTVVDERIMHAAGAETARGITRDDICRLIVSAGLKPVERDTFYREVEVKR